LIKSILRKNLSKKLAIIWLLGSFFIAQAPLQAMVLCIEADGSIEVEAANNGVCASGSGKTSKEIHSLSTKVEDDAHCGQCVDIPFSIGNADHQNLLTSLKTSQLIKAPVDASISVDMPAFRDRSIGVPFRRHDHQKSNTLISIRSVIIIV